MGMTAQGIRINTICQKPITELETFGPVSYPMCWDHWWECIQGEISPEQGEDKPTQGSSPGQINIA
jgi:hypothetical protein